MPNILHEKDNLSRIENSKDKSCPLLCKGGNSESSDKKLLEVKYINATLQNENQKLESINESSESKHINLKIKDDKAQVENNS